MDPMSFPWSFFQAHHPHKQKKYLIQFRSNGSNKIPIKPSRLITAASKCQQFHGILPFAAFLAGAQDTVESNDLGRQKVLAVVIFSKKKSITTNHKTTASPSDIDFYLQALHLFQQTASSLAIGRHEPTGHPSTGGAFGENDAMLWGPSSGWSQGFPQNYSIHLNPSYAQVKFTVDDLMIFIAENPLC